jgi:hypothetical protein
VLSDDANSLLGAAAWPLVARGQQSALPVIGLLNGVSFEAYANRVAAFRQGLNEGHERGNSTALAVIWVTLVDTTSGSVTVDGTPLRFRARIGCIPKAPSRLPTIQQQVPRPVDRLARRSTLSEGGDGSEAQRSTTLRLASVSPWM